MNVIVLQMNLQIGLDIGLEIIIQERADVHLGIGVNGALN